MADCQPEEVATVVNAQGTLGFRTTIESVTECGRTCRNVRVRIENTGTVTAHDVVVDTVISTGGTIIWTGSEEVGRLSSGETYVTTRTLDLSYEDGLRVRRNDNVVSAKMIIRSAEGDLVLERTVDVTTLETVDRSSPNLKAGSESTVDVDGTRYYVIDDLPGEPPNRLAVTTPDYELVSPTRARAVIDKKNWSGMRWGLDWQTEIEETLKIRENNADNRAIGRALDLSWDVTEILIFVSTGFPQASIGPILDGATDAIGWAVDDVQQPYRDSFQQMTACLSNAQTVRQLLQDVMDSGDLSGTLQNYVDGLQLLADTYDETVTLTKAWSRVFASGTTYGASTAAKSALAESTGFFVGFAVSSTVGELESVIKAKSKIHAIGHAFATVRLPVLYRLQTLDTRLKRGTHRYGDGIEYYLDLQSNYQMLALAYRAMGKYWQKISDSVTGGVWDVLVDAQTKANEARKTAKTMLETARQVALIHGQVHNKTDTLLDQSLNRAAARSTPRETILSRAEVGR